MLTYDEDQSTVDDAEISTRINAMERMMVEQRQLIMEQQRMINEQKELINRQNGVIGGLNNDTYEGDEHMEG